MKEKKPKKGFLDGYKTYDTSQGFGSIKDWREWTISSSVTIQIQ